jgi:hypothetical protein
MLPSSFSSSSSFSSLFSRRPNLIRDRFRPKVSHWVLAFMLAAGALAVFNMWYYVGYVHEPNARFASDGARQNFQVHIRGEPKSGTTWLTLFALELQKQYCLAQPGCEIYPHQQVNIVLPENPHTRVKVQVIDGPRHVIPFLEESSICTADLYSSYWHLGISERDRLPAHPSPCDDGLRSYEALVEQCFKAKCDEARIHIPENFRERGHEFVFVWRDPRDVVVSLYYYLSMDKAGVPLSEYIRSHFKTVAQRLAFRFWWQEHLREQSRYVYYGGSKPHIGEQLVRALGFPLDEALIAKSIALTTPEALRKKEQSGELPGRNAANSNAAKVRSAGATNFYSAKIFSEADLLFLNESTVAFMPRALMDVLDPTIYKFVK